MKRSLVIEEEEYSLPELPIEMWLEILSHLVTRQLRRYATVCKLWPSLVDQSITATMCVPSPSLVRLARLRNLATLVLSTTDTFNIEVCLKEMFWPNTHLFAASLTSLDMQAMGSRPYTNDRQGYAALATLTNLKSLRLGYANTVDGLALRSLTNLTELTIECLTNFGWGTLCDDDLCGLKKLTRLRLVKSAITDECLSKLTTLQRLKLRGNKAITSASLARLTGLTRLSIYGDLDVTTSLSTRLLSLKMEKNMFVTNAHLKSLTGLQALSISNCGRINNKAILRLGQLTRLVSEGFHSDYALECACLLPNLRSLQIQVPRVSDKLSANEYLTRMTQLTTLCIRDNNLFNKGLRALTLLTSLDLRWGTLSTFRHEHFMSLPLSLCTLSLAYNAAFVPSVYDTLVRLTNLTSLELCGSTQDFIMSGSFQRLTTLRTLSLDHPKTRREWREFSAIQALVSPTINITYRG